MKYKNINSYLNNLGHSFCSDLNYIESKGPDVARNIIKSVLMTSKVETIIIDLISGSVSPTDKFSTGFIDRVQTYISSSRKIAISMNIETSKFSSLFLKFHLENKSNAKSLKCIAECTCFDGKTYAVEAIMNNK